MKGVVLALSVVGLTMLGGSASAYIVSSTGVGLSDGALDLNWTVTRPDLVTVQAVALNYSGNPFPYNAYAANDASSQWISFQADGGLNLSSPPQTLWTYSTTVDFSGSNGTLSGHLWSDNSVRDIKVGATSYGTSPLLGGAYGDGDGAWFTTGKDFSITGLSGIQVVSFTIMNGVPGGQYNPDPTAFRARLGLEAVPEPFTVGLGLAAAGAFVRRRVKSKTA